MIHWWRYPIYKRQSQFDRTRFDPFRCHQHMGERMKFPARTVSFFWLPLILWVLGAGGCLPDSRYSPYTYDAVQAHYADSGRRVASRLEKEQTGLNHAVNRPINLKEIIEIALANNPDKMMAIARIQQAEADLMRANAAFFPAIGFYTEYMEGDAPSAYLFKKIDQRQLPPQTNFNRPGRIENWESGLTGRLNLFNGGRNLLDRMMAETGVAISRLDQQAVENSLVASAIQAYYNSLAARAFIDIARESAATVESQLRVMEVRYRAGGALKSDLLSLQVRLAEARQTLVDSENQYRIALTALSNVMGVNPEPPLRLEKAKVLPVRVPQHYLGGVAYALEHRPEMEKVRQQLVRSRMNIDRARAGYLPRVDLQGKYYMDDPDLDYETDRENWTVGVMLNWDIFTGFSTRAEELKAKAALDEMLSADRKTALSVKMDVKNAYLNAEAARARLEVAQASVAAAEESLSLVKKQYEGGSATITRYLEAELDRNRARTRAAAAYYDRDKAIADIARAVGYWARISADNSGTGGGN